MRVIRLAALIATAQVALVVLLFSFGYSIAHADSTFSGCDITADTMSGGLAAQANCLTNPVTIPTGGLTLYGVTLHVLGGASEPLYYQYGGSHSADNGCYLSSTSVFTAGTIQYVSFANHPITITAGSDTMMVHFYREATCSTGSTWTVYYNGAGWPYNGYAIFNWTPIIPPPSNGVGFVEILPIAGTTTPTTSVEFKAQYYVASTSIEATAGHGGFGLSSTKYSFNLSRQDTASTSQWFVANGAGNDAWNTLDKTITLPASSTWMVSWTSYDASSTYPTYQRGAYYFFSVVSNAAFAGLGIAGLDQIPNLSSASTTAIAPAPCGITDISGCFQNAIVYLFYPSTASLDQFGNLWTLVKNKPPFGYVVAVQTAVGTLSASSTATFNLGTVPFMSAIFDPFRTAVAVLMWLVFIVAFYHRLSTLDI